MKPVVNFLKLILMLQNKHLTLIAEHDSLWFTPRVKATAFGLSTGFACFACFYDFGCF